MGLNLILGLSLNLVRNLFEIDFGLTLKDTHQIRMINKLQQKQRKFKKNGEYKKGGLIRCSIDF